MAAQAPAARVQAAPTAPSGLGARLRAAAAAGRIAEVNDLLAQGVPVDARDSDGETALMKSVRANRPEMAALLRRGGADPDLKNRAGVSARDMAGAAGNPALERALAPDR
jgi:ankyrin repeat protein